MTKRIFTFWEPKDKIPAYLQLCLDTWKKFLPDYEIVILDYSNLKEWLGKNVFPQVLYDKFSLPIQSDAIRCAVLKKHGGIWMDVDTVITSNKVYEILEKQAQFILINKHIAFIVADSKSKILNSWYKEIHHSLYWANKYYDNKTPFLFKLFIEQFLFKNSWDCLGNSILKKALKTKNKKVLLKINGEQIKALPEINYSKINNLNIFNNKNYENFYFYNDYSDFALKDNGGIILLHNSWTPKEFKQMSKEEFLKTNNTLANILQKILVDGTIE